LAFLVVLERIVCFCLGFATRLTLLKLDGILAIADAGRSWMHLHAVDGGTFPGRTVQDTSFAFVNPGSVLHDE
jgi:hypothetical protein